MTSRSDLFRFCVTHDLRVRHRYLLQALVVVCVTIVALVPITSFSLDIIKDRFPIFLALVSTIAVELPDSHRTHLPMRGNIQGNTQENIHPGEGIPRGSAHIAIEPEEQELRGRPLTAFLPLPSFNEHPFLHMGGGTLQPAQRTSTHASSISLSQSGLSRPRSSWDSPARRAFEQDQAQTEPEQSNVHEPDIGHSQSDQPLSSH